MVFYRVLLLAPDVTVQKVRDAFSFVVIYVRKSRKDICICVACSAKRKGFGEARQVVIGPLWGAMTYACYNT